MKVGFKMKKVILSSVNSKYIHSSLAVWYLKNNVNVDNVNIEILEWTINKDKDEFVECLVKEDADIYAFSCYIWNIEYVLYTVKKVKEERPNSIIILGGPEVSYNSRDVLDNNDVDFIISGEGEIPFNKLIDNLCTGESTEGIDGVFTKTGDSEIFVSNIMPSSPFTDEYFDNLSGRIVYFETSRGCPFSCSFCLSGRKEGVRYFDIDYVKSELIKLANSGTKTIKFVDRTFNSSASRAVQIVKLIKNEYEINIPKGVEFHFEIAGDILTEEFITEISSVPKGLFRIEIGLQTFNENTLTYINRKTSTKRLIANIEKLISCENIHVHIDLIAGLPLEDYTSFKESFNIAYKLKPNVLQLGILKLLHGSPMDSDRQGEFSKQPPYEVKYTPWLSESDIELVMEVEEVLDKLFNTERFKRFLSYVSKYYDNSFDMFLDIAQNCDLNAGESLDLTTEKLYKYFVDREDNCVLKDVMIEERLLTNKSGKFPYVLRDDEYKMGKLIAKLDMFKEFRKQSGVKRAAAYLRSTGEVIWVDYTDGLPKEVNRIMYNVLEKE